MRLAANLQRSPGVNAATVPLKDIFRMATVSGSLILGWGELTGTLESGKRADMILLDSRTITGPYLSLDQSPIDALLYRGRASVVDTVIIDGEIIYQGKRHRRVNSKSLLKQLRASIQPAVEDDGESLEAELLPHAIRYYQAWDDEALIPHHIVNSV
jgi:5-methylthioadenosine/S-adenosylhomocysteine deaminase